MFTGLIILGIFAIAGLLAFGIAVIWLLVKVLIALIDGL